MSLVICFQHDDQTQVKFFPVLMFFFFQLSQFLENLSIRMSNAGDLDGILLTGTYSLG